MSLQLSACSSVEGEIPKNIFSECSYETLIGNKKKRSKENNL